MVPGKELESEESFKTQLLKYRSMRKPPKIVQHPGEGQEAAFNNYMSTGNIGKEGTAGDWCTPSSQSSKVAEQSRVSCASRHPRLSELSRAP